MWLSYKKHLIQNHFASASKKPGDMIKIAEKVKKKAAITLTKEIIPQMGYYKDAYKKLERCISVLLHKRKEQIA